jgi:hypothetical protein
MWVTRKSGGRPDNQIMSGFSNTTNERAPVYALGHSPRELERLAVQARLVDPITRAFLREAGIAPGMRVLDVGCGAGDVAFLAADLVGRDGAVIGIERPGGDRQGARPGASPRAAQCFLSGRRPRRAHVHATVRCGRRPPGADVLSRSGGGAG